MKINGLQAKFLLIGDQGHVTSDNDMSVLSFDTNGHVHLDLPKLIIHDEKYPLNSTYSLILHSYVTNNRLINGRFVTQIPATLMTGI